MNRSRKDTTIEEFLAAKAGASLKLFHHFITEYNKLGNVTLHPAKTMIGIADNNRRIAWITQFGKNFIHVVFPFKTPYYNNLCFHKVAQVPGDANQFNHHFRMCSTEDVNDEVIKFMQLAYAGERLSP